MQAARTLSELLQFYPFEDAELIANLPTDHWFNIHFSLLTRAPYRQELYMEIPPAGLLSGIEAVDGNGAGSSGTQINQNGIQSAQTMEQIGHEGVSGGSMSDIAVVDDNMNRTHDVNSVTAVNRHSVLMPVNDTNDHVIQLQHPNTPVAHNNVDQAVPVAPFVAAEAEIQALNDEQREDDEDNLPGPEANHIMNNGTIFEGIYVPTTGTDRQRLIEFYRNEIINDEVHDLANLHGLVNIATNANDLELLEMQDAIHTNGHRVPQFHLHVNDIRRHDWDRTGNCIYTVRVEGRPFRGDALSLQARLFGVRMALWNYWAHRPTVNAANIHFYVNHFGIFGFYQAIMWHHLHENRWLVLWYRRRASRRG
ncbi:hypothetical protein QFC24_003304 [Naganishia onofrii]|uniref:Uncharacterized protein n=1 Tax=Naganishia onofrii TaxID=1851511 RepID=A0ACC2XKY5_9TREE|nr:hypothetical protein QFC24_003304 [Naganishia onofrii]